MTLYTLHKITQRYKQRTVLDIDAMEIEAGGIIALLGANGAGKSTLLNILGFLESPTTGDIVFNGQKVAPSRSTLLRLRRQVVLVDQHPIMFSTTANANLEFGLRIRKIEKAQRQRIIDEALDIVALRPFKYAAAHELSGGETQRLALARALALKPDVLLCDEPTASVDAENQGVISAILQQINASRGTTIIFTTHDRLQAVALAHQTVVLENGKLTATTYENYYSCTLLREHDNQWSCMVQGKMNIPLCLPPDTPFAGPRRVYIDPSKITLARGNDHFSPNQALSGTVALVMVEGQGVRILVNVGVMIAVFMDSACYRRERPLVGETVTLHLAADAVHLLA